MAMEDKLELVRRNHFYLIVCVGERRGLTTFLYFLNATRNFYVTRLPFTTAVFNQNLLWGIHSSRPGHSPF